jgi:Tfp pilus assembly protein PilX
MRTRHDAQMVAAMSPSPQSGTPAGAPALQAPRGVALILVMLAMLVLSVLAATIVFTARAETFASTNYKLDTQADYLAKAGIQRAINWFRSTHYRPVSQTQASTYYDVSSTGSPYNLWISNTSPVKTCASPPCLAFNKTVQLIGFGSGVSQYPDMINSEAAPRRVAVAFASDLNDSSFTHNRISGDPTNSGYYTINATLLDYETVNVSPPPSPLPSYCVPNAGAVACPMETWLIESRAMWTGSSSSTATAATAEEVAIIQPVYWPTWGNALYGFCSVSMSGSAGTCTDAFNSALGPYADGTVGVASGHCDSLTSANVIATGAGVGANGHVDLGSNVTVGGNVTIGSSPSGGSSCCTPSSSPACGYNGGSSSVLGEVVNGPPIAKPPSPTFRTNFPTGAPTYSLGSNDVQVLPIGKSWPTSQDPNPATWPTANNPANAAPPYSSNNSPCMDTSCDGTAAHPYEISSISMTGGGKGGNAPILELTGGPNPGNPVYYDIDSLSQNQGNISVSGYVVLNIKTSLSVGGNGISNGIAATIPPEAVQINYKGTNAVTVNGNGAVSAVLSAPNATVNLGGGGAAGYWVGAIQANNVSVQGGYPIHYDTQLSRVGGSLGAIVSTAYGRKKM